MRTKLLLSVGLCAITALLMSVCGAQPLPKLTFLEKSVGGESTKIPVLQEFAKACAESPQFAARAAALTPKTSELVTCFVPTNKWRDLQSNKATDLYPVMSVIVSSSDEYTPEIFRKMKDAARKQLGELVNDGSAKGRIVEQDAAMARSGSSMRRENYQQGYGGLYATPQDVPSFAYLSTRSATQTENGVSMQLDEVVATAVVLRVGRLLMLSVVDKAAADRNGIAAQDITLRWLKAYAELN